MTSVREYTQAIRDWNQR